MIPIHLTTLPPHTQDESCLENRIFDVAWRLLASGAVETEAVVQPVVPFDALLDEYPKIATAPGENIKLGVRFASDS